MFWGFLSQVQVLKVGMSDVEFNPFLSQEEAPQVLCCLLTVTSNEGVEEGLSGMTMSQPFLPAWIRALSGLSDA